ncbi:O-antigen ligase family protein [Nocardioides houyundeii]|uniref:O-antigen ligase family protein n=1 Tax=Nocardioides houyundeii TaxID=2045452 RepID=UPI0013B417FA|nr:O-antigen ligase family protein [Nocardioides houyundeii]
MSVPFASDQFVGYGRYVGFGANAPLVSFELAVAFVLAFLVPRMIPRVFAMTLILMGLLVCGGRGGLVALSVALVVVLLLSKRYRKSVIGLGVIGLFGGVYLSSSSLSLSTLERFIAPGATSADVTSGRGSLLQASLTEFLNNPFTGTGLESFSNLYGTTPHMALLSFGVAGGVIPALCVALVTLALARSAWIRRNEVSPIIALVSVFLVWILLEPTGPLVGLLGLLLLAYVLPSFESSKREREPSASTA